MRIAPVPSSVSWSASRTVVAHATEARAADRVPAERVIEGELLGRTVAGRPFIHVGGSRPEGRVRDGVAFYLNTAGAERIRPRAGLDCYA